MSEQVFNSILVGWMVLAVLVFIALFFTNAPYGRYFNATFGPTVKGKLGWVLMEAPASLVFAFVFINKIQVATFALLVFFIMWELHYFDRAFVYPLMRRISIRRFPLAIIAAGFSFNAINAYLNVHYITMNAQKYSILWLHDPLFYVGFSIFLLGFIVNRSADYILYRIRAGSIDEYGVPAGGFYRWISCPNYFGEILIWTGWALATWSPVGAAFLLWTVANLAPRALSHHRWYHNHFENYPAERRILIPGLW